MISAILPDVFWKRFRDDRIKIVPVRDNLV